MSLSAVLVQTDFTRRHRVFKIRVTPTNAVNYATGGDPLDLTAVTNPKALVGGFFTATSIPTVDQVEFPDNLAGSDLKWVAGTTLANAKVKVMAVGAEHAAGVYTAAELADSFDIIFRLPIGK